MSILDLDFDEGNSSDDSAFHFCGEIVKPVSTRWAIHDAAENGNVELLRELLEKEKTQKPATEPSQLPLLDATSKQEQTATQAQPGESKGGDSDSEWEQPPDSGGESEGDSSPEHAPGTSTHSALDRRDFDGCTALHMATLNAHLECVQALVEARADVTLNCAGSSLLHVAISVASFSRHRDFPHRVLPLLLSSGCSLDAVDEEGRTPLHLAALNNLPDIVDLILNHPSFTGLRAVDKHGNSVLHWAVKGHSLSLLSVLASKQLDVLAVNNARETALHLAAKLGNLDTCKQLFELWQPPVPQLLNSKDERLMTALEWAVHLSHVDVAHFLEKLNPGGLTAALSEPKQRKTLIVRHPLCDEHHTCAPIVRAGHEPPSENVRRLHVLCDENYGILRTREFEDLEWEESPQPCAIVDVLAVHEFKYVQSIRKFCEKLTSPNEVGELDGDTSVSLQSFQAALVAAGAVTTAIDAVMRDKYAAAFCPVRPPGHHAGASGIVTCAADDRGSHGFCLLNNVAIGAAYVRRMYRHAGISRVAILDFDVHHGNGTEDIIRSLVPRTIKQQLPLGAAGDIQFTTVSYKPWLNDLDRNEVYFASVHGFGHKGSQAPWFYPGSGATSSSTVDLPSRLPNNNIINNLDPSSSSDASSSFSSSSFSSSSSSSSSSGNSQPPQHTFLRKKGPHILNVGMAHRESRQEWRRIWEQDVLGSLREFRPDFIFISAGFDAHCKDSINYGYLGLATEDYEWVTHAIMGVAALTNAPVVSVLEGGYKIQGRVVSPFARSVAAHVRALAHPIPNPSSHPIQSPIQSPLPTLDVVDLTRKRERIEPTAAAAPIVVVQDDEDAEDAHSSKKSKLGMGANVAPAEATIAESK